MEITFEAVAQLKNFMEDFDMPYVRVGQITTGGG
jgi:hypothetical protein